MTNASIKHWATDDQPREKLLQKGPHYLSNSELIAVLINKGTQDKNAVALAKELLIALDNDLSQLSRLTVPDILGLNIKGIGMAKAVSIAAALELGLRRDAHFAKRKKISHSKEVVGYVRSKLQYKKQEHFAVIFLNQGNRINHFQIISEGGISATIADPRIILKKALAHDATSLVLCHNHPSGNTQPSRADISLTHKIKEAALTLDIHIMDHVIISEEGYYSFADNGLL